MQTQDLSDIGMPWYYPEELSWRRWLRGRRCGYPCLGRCSHNLALDKWQEMNGLAESSVQVEFNLHPQNNFSHILTKAGTLRLNGAFPLHYQLQYLERAVIRKQLVSYRCQQ